MSKNKVSYIKQDEPSFIKKFKQQIGYVEDPGIDAKRKKLAEDGRPASDDEEERDDEQPTVVMLEAGDLSEKDAEALRKAGLKLPDDDKDANEGGRIFFKKPTKKNNDNTSEEVKFTKRRSNEDDVAKRKKIKAVDNKCLLSFDEDEEES